MGIDGYWFFTGEPVQVKQSERVGRPVVDNFQTAVRRAGFDTGYIIAFHTHATLALQAGVHPRVVSERLGHSTISLTLDTYSHAIPALQAEAAQIVAALVEQAQPRGEQRSS